MATITEITSRPSLHRFHFEHSVFTIFFFDVFHPFVFFYVFSNVLPLVYFLLRLCFLSLFIASVLLFAPNGPHVDTPPGSFVASVCKRIVEAAPGRYVFSFCEKGCPAGVLPFLPSLLPFITFPSFIS